jgi:hypothetical protein
VILQRKGLLGLCTLDYLWGVYLVSDHRRTAGTSFWSPPRGFQVFKISSPDPYGSDQFEPDSNEHWPTTHHNLHHEFWAAFAAATVDLADFKFYTDPTEQLHHYNLTPHSSPLILTPSTQTNSPINIHSIPMAANIPMPACSDCTTPKFDLTHPREPRRYFSDLDFILGLARITDNTEKKTACHMICQCWHQRTMGSPSWI